jgi:chromosome segregation ATPase
LANSISMSTSSSPWQQQSSSNNNFSHVTEIIRAKERELHHFQDLRNAQLESIIAEKEKLMLETRQKFELLKDDFQYNLKLIEARDKEIERLEQTIKVHVKRGDELEQKVRSLNAKIDSLQLKDTERQEKIEQDKIMQKVYVYKCIE